jgi:hypothetical protein
LATRDCFLFDQRAVSAPIGHKVHICLEPPMMCVHVLKKRKVIHRITPSAVRLTDTAHMLTAAMLL